MINFEILKGTKDFEPKEQIRINYILDIIRENFEKYGFRPFDTPIIELMSTLTCKYNDDAEIINEIFKLKDRGSRNLGLRYDLTTPLIRFVSSKKQLKLPFKRYQIGKVFRDGPIKKGRMREFIQCDGDIIGIDNIEIEADLMNLFYNTYKQIGINSIIELNNNKILKGAFLQVGFKEEELSSLILSVDKLKKIGIEGVLKEIESKNLNSLRAEDAIKILSSNSFEDLEKLTINDLLKEGLDELKTLVDLISNQDISYRLNFSMSRGLDIYTGNIWEVYDLDENISSSLGSGGRYNKIIGEYSGLNNEIPAVGISFGLVPIFSVLENLNKISFKNSLTNILVVPLEKNLFGYAQKIANIFRAKGENVEISFDYKLKKAFSYMESMDIENIIVIGEKDIENKKYILKNIKTKKEEEFNL